MVAYRFEDSRGGESVERHLAGYTGLLQVDGWGAYNRLADARSAGGPLALAACWVHLRRNFYELHVSGVSAVASETVERMAGLWAVEEEIRGQHPDFRRATRQEQSAAIIAELWPFWEKELGRISGKSKLAEAIRYARSRREALERFLHDGRLDIDSNAVERAIRRQTISGSFCPCWAGGRDPLSLASVFRVPSSLRVQRRARAGTHRSPRRCARQCHHRSGLGDRSGRLRRDGAGSPKRIAGRAA
ncbi:IS66 family transposase [Allomesorhizobium alhagi]|uniref:Transposase IS66 n=1 Tax=Mesorhizobium alhagi CCNWXJ12-2 TaxID=1107882 RepID=H0HWN3_9HYPH|nr:transposase IS66 [Mesorhizobium alhagi CCNWXJ12-2]